MAKVRLKFEIEKRNGEIINPSGIIQDVIWSGDLKSPSRELSFSLINPTFDEQEIRKLGIGKGDTIKMFVDYNDKGFKEEYRGRIIDVDKDSGTQSRKYVSKDCGMYLNSQIAMNIEDKSTEDVAKDVINTISKINNVKVGNLAKTGQKYSKVVTKSTGYEVIQARYTEASHSTGKKYMTYAYRDTINVTEKGVNVLNIRFNESENIFNTTYKGSIEKMINRVVVTDDQGNKVSQNDDKAMIELYKITMQAIRGELKKPEKKVTMKAVGNIKLMTGRAVHVKDEATGLTGVFYVDNDKHDFVENGYTTTVDLNFENIMDEREITEQATTDGEAVYGSGGELIGKKVKALFSRYCPKGGGINGGNETASGQRIDYSKKTCAGPRSVKMFSNIQVLGTGTRYDGNIYVKNDHGGRIKILSDGTYRFDLLMSSVKEAMDFGKRKGYAMIGAPGQPKFASVGGTGGGNSRAVQLAMSQKGKPYRWGATGPSSFDCSGLIYWVAKQMGKSIPRTSSEQSRYGQAVSKSALQPGDLVFFGKKGVHHVGMYIGGGNFIHAPQTGDVVKITALSSRGDFHNARRFL